jgi:hypothetical protein
MYSRAERSTFGFQKSTGLDTVEHLERCLSLMHAYYRHSNHPSEINLWICKTDVLILMVFHVLDDKHTMQGSQKSFSSGKETLNIYS